MVKTRAPYPPEFWQQVVELVRSGRSPEELGRQFEPSRNWVAQADPQPVLCGIAESKILAS